MKKIIYLSLIIIIMLSALALFSCGDSEDEGGNNGSGDSATLLPEHIHTYDMQTWVKSEDGHYNPCTCHPEAYNIKSHVDNLDWNGVCDVCQYVLASSDTYTVTVVDQEGKPVQGVEIMFRSNYDITTKTDAQGKATAEFTDVSGVNAWVVSLPDGYELPKSTDDETSRPNDIFPFDGMELTITVSKNIVVE